MTRRRPPPTVTAIAAHAPPHILNTARAANTGPYEEDEDTP